MQRPWCMEEDHRGCRGQAGILGASAHQRQFVLRLHDKHNKYKDQLVESIDRMLGLLMYQRCMFGDHDIVLKEVDPQLVEHAFGRIKIIQGHAVTVMDEPFVSKAVENYFAAIDPYFAREVRKRMVKSTPIE
jgi:hypothetical protein